jgi:hypothetical protein
MKASELEGPYDKALPFDFKHSPSPLGVFEPAIASNTASLPDMYRRQDAANVAGSNFGLPPLPGSGARNSFSAHISADIRRVPVPQSRLPSGSGSGSGSGSNSRAGAVSESESVLSDHLITPTSRFRSCISLGVVVRIMGSSVHYCKGGTCSRIGESTKM